jgi:hypothetical protein
MMSLTHLMPVPGGGRHLLVIHNTQSSLGGVPHWRFVPADSGPNQNGDPCHCDISSQPNRCTEPFSRREPVLAR